MNNGCGSTQLVATVHGVCVCEKYAAQIAMDRKKTVQSPGLSFPKAIDPCRNDKIKHNQV